MRTILLAGPISVAVERARAAFGSVLTVLTGLDEPPQALKLSKAPLSRHAAAAKLTAEPGDSSRKCEILHVKSSFIGVLVYDLVLRP
jgi:hypothetical protein